MYRSLIIIDDFLLDPMEIREKALGLDYPVPSTRPVSRLIDVMN